MNFKKSIAVCVLLSTFMMLFTGCGKEDTSRESVQSTQIPDNTQSETVDSLEVKFGYEGESFTLHLEDNETAAEIARIVGRTEWNLPIYNYDNYENWEVMQYYDIPSRYEIPSEPELISTQSAGEVYYSDPNRIILFYKDAQVEGEYTKIGYFDYSDDFLQAVENNPVLEGWGNKIISISR